MEKEKEKEHKARVAATRGAMVQILKTNAVPGARLLLGDEMLTVISAPQLDEGDAHRVVVVVHHETFGRQAWDFRRILAFATKAQLAGVACGVSDPYETTHFRTEEVSIPVFVLETAVQLIHNEDEEEECMRVPAEVAELATLRDFASLTLVALPDKGGVCSAQQSGQTLAGPRYEHLFVVDPDEFAQADELMQRENLVDGETKVRVEMKERAAAVAVFHANGEVDLVFVDAAKKTAVRHHACNVGAMSLFEEEWTSSPTRAPPRFGEPATERTTLTLSEDGLHLIRDMNVMETDVVETALLASPPMLGSRRFPFLSFSLSHG